MKALFIEAHGTVDVVRFGSIPDPQPGRGQVRVAMKAAALNHLDLFVVGGLPGLALQMPHVLGADGAGVVDAAGEAVTSVKPGDRVMLNPLLSCGSCEFCRAGEHSLCIKVGIVGEHQQGTLAEYFVVPEENLHRIPDGVGFEEAAAFSLVFQTAWRMLMSRGRLRAGEDLLIHGIGSGVSLAALAIGKLTGARVFVTSSSDSKLEKAKALGADFLYNYREHDITRAVLSETGKRGVDVVVDSVGAGTWIQSLQSVRKGGRIVTCGATAGPNPAEEIRLIFWKQIEIIGSTMSNQAEYAQVVRLLGNGKLRPVIDRVFALEGGREAIEHLHNAAQFGKVVITVDSGKSA